MADFYELLSHRISKDDPFTQFAIMTLQIFRISLSEPNIIVASRLNNCVRMLNFLVEKYDSVSTDKDEQDCLWPFFPKPENATVPAIVSNLTSRLQSSNPAKQRESISNLRCLDKIDHVEQRGDRPLVFMKDNNSGSSVALGLTEIGLIACDLLNFEQKVSGRWTVQHLRCSTSVIQSCQLKI
ncbi:hypothetical protein QYM36_004481 [Artemia franciscana]|uniref:Uncharacterized protein n=1 Tax=Artemia franciscana TaxID=6661 RepID=A0AA88I671_ARTSF|nr:hypothetical protein QYM36_004481 [Artemia franciscana]